MKLLSIAIVSGLCAFAGAPVITELQPRGAERGKPFTLTILGRDLPEGGQISSTMPATFTPVIPSATSPGMMMAPGRTSTFLVEPKDEMTQGVYPIRIQSASGISNILLFSVGTFPEQGEAESAPYAPPNKNDSIEAAEPIGSTPITMNGTLRGAERDLFRVHGKAGERRVFEVEARRAGSAIDPVIRILDGNGKLLARSEDTPGTGLDARIEFAFPREGYYYVEIHDARFSRQVQNFYRLKIGTYAFADGLFPLGGRRGEAVPVTFQGGNLAAPVKGSVDLKSIPANHVLTSAPTPNSPTLPFTFAVSDLPELIEPAQPVAIPSVINGRLSQTGEVDRYKLAVQPGDKLLIEMQARELGSSRIEGIITAYDATGKKIDSAGDKPLPEDVFAVQGTSRTSSDPFLNLTVPGDTHELALTVEDLAERGGANFGYRVAVRKVSEDFELTVTSPFVNVPAGGSAIVSVNADRRGYDGPIQATIPDLPAGIHVEGGYIPPETMDANNTRSFSRRGVLVLSADPGVEMPPRELLVYGQGKLDDGTALKVRARGLAMAVDVTGATAQGVVDRQRAITAPWLGFDLPSATAAPQEATLSVKQTKLTRMVEGDRYDFEYSWKLRGDVELPKELSVEVIGGRDIRIQGFKKSGNTGSFAITTTKATLPASYDVIARGRIKLDGRDEDIYARPLPLVVTKMETPNENATAASR